MEDDILRDFEQLKMNGGGDEAPDQTYVQDISFRSTAVYKDLVQQMQEEKYHASQID